MEGNKHFSHDHPLISFLEENYEDDDKGYLCSLCGLPILSSPSYTCTLKTCNFFLHKPCADNFPEDLIHPNHGHRSFRNPRLHLVPSGKNYTYKCRRCEFHIHPLELQPVAIKTMHKSHQTHPLTAVCLEITCRCNACAEEHKGFFFCCQSCNFWIHQDCALLPSFVEIPSSQHHFPFILTYYIDFSVLSYINPDCFICGGYGHHVLHDGVYLCGDSLSYAHVSCVKSEMVPLDTDATKRGIIQLPDEEEDIFPSLVIRRYAEGINPDLRVSQHHYNKEFHEHGLILDEGTRTNNNDDNNDSSSSSTTGRRAPHSLICDVCTQRIDNSSPFFRCELHDCRFLVHTICASLPTKIRYLDVWDWQWRESSIGRHMKYFNAVSYCDHCWHFSNGYNCDREPPYYNVDLECMVTPRTIKHASHPKHVLFELPYRVFRTTFSCCSSSSYIARIFRCVVCEFYIHKRCALLPKWTHHKFDEHPLELITTAAAHHHNHEDDDDDEQECVFCEFYIHKRCALLPKWTHHKFDEHPLELITTAAAHHHNHEDDDDDEQECVFCEFCEQDIDRRYWYYICRKCEHYFHINCVPSVGKLSKVKFGKTLAVDANIHPHPVTLTRMLTIGRHERCGICNQIIEGFVDKMALHCSECNFWIHFKCLEDPVYSDSTDSN